MPHPNPPAKQNLDKKGLLTISNSAYCNFTWYMAISSITLPSREVGGGEGEGEGLLIFLTPPATGGGEGATVHTRQQTNNKKGEEKLQVCMCFHLQ